MKNIKVNLLVYMVFVLCQLQAQENYLSFSSFPDTLIFNKDYSFKVDYNSTDSSTISYWEWKLLYDDHNYIIDSGFDSIESNQFEITINIDSIAPDFGYYVSYNDLEQEIKSFRPTLYFRAFNSKNQSLHLKNNILVLGDTIPLCYCSYDDIYISENIKKIYEDDDTTLTVIFEDMEGKGYNIDYWHWKVCLLNDSLSYVLVKADSVFGHNICSWNFEITGIPSGYNWIKNDDGSIRAYAFVMGKTDDKTKIFYDYMSFSLFPKQTAISDFKKTIDQSFSLYQNYPNPFNPLTVIRYKLEKKSKVYLHIYNTLGERVKTCINGMIKNEGSYSIIWDGKSDSNEILPTGIYFYRITAGDISQTKRMILLR